MYHLAMLLGFVRRKVKWTGPFHSAHHFFSPVVERNFLAAKHKFSSCFENILFCCWIKRFPKAFSASFGLLALALKIKKRILCKHFEHVLQNTDRQNVEIQIEHMKMA
jgi:hypothetical protein